MREELGDLPVIAEDLGVITPAVERLRDELGLPGMHVLQWAFVAAATSPHRLENHRENGVVYTGTHDNDTAVGWWRRSSAEERAATGLDGRPGVVADRARVLLRPRSRSSRCRTCSASAARRA